MRTNIDIDDDLMRQAMRSSGARTKRAVVEEGLRLLIRTRDQRGVRRLRGKVAWEGDLERSRLGRSTKWSGVVIVDTTVWVDYFRGVRNREADWLDTELDRQRLGLTDIILCEVLQGVHDDSAAAVERRLRKLEIFETGGIDLTTEAARDFDPFETYLVLSVIHV
jgi:Arc/MetJ family transcription regulator